MSFRHFAFATPLLFTFFPIVGCANGVPVDPPTDNLAGDYEGAPSVSPTATSPTPAPTEPAPIGEPDGGERACLDDDACAVGESCGVDGCEEEPPFVDTQQIVVSTSQSSLLGSDFKILGLVVNLAAEVGTRVLSDNERFSGQAIDVNGDVDALFEFADGRVVYSTSSSGMSIGLNSTGSDLLIAAPGVDGQASSAEIFFDTSAFLSCSGMMCTQGIDAVHVLADGTVLLSTTDDGDVNASGAAIQNGSILSYDPETEELTERISAERLWASGNIDAISVNPETGRLVLSYSNSGSFGGGLSFAPQDLIELSYEFAEPTDEQISYELLLDGDAELEGADDVDAVHFE